MFILLLGLTKKSINFVIQAFKIYLSMTDGVRCMSNPNIYQFVRFALLVTLRMFEVMAVNACDVFRCVTIFQCINISDILNYDNIIFI